MTRTPASAGRLLPNDGRVLIVAAAIRRCLVAGVIHVDAGVNRARRIVQRLIEANGATARV